MIPPVTPPSVAVFARADGDEELAVVPVVEDAVTVVIVEVVGAAEVDAFHELDDAVAGVAAPDAEGQHHGVVLCPFHHRGWIVARSCDSCCKGDRESRLSIREFANLVNGCIQIFKF